MDNTLIYVHTNKNYMYVYLHTLLKVNDVYLGYALFSYEFKNRFLCKCNIVNIIHTKNIMKFDLIFC